MNENECQTRVVKWTQNPLVLFAKLRNRNLCLLRKLRIFIFRLNHCESIFIRINQLEFGQNDHREDAPHFSFGSRRILFRSFLPKYEIFRKKNSSI